MPNPIKITCLILACMFLLSCGDKCASPPCDTPRMLTQQERELVSAYNEFGFSMFRQLVLNAPPDTNIFISPMSISMALGMTLNGAAGATEEAMKTTLEFNGMDIAQMDACYRSVIDLLTNLDPDVVFEIANSIWHRPDLNPKPEFLDACETYFDSEVTALDFSRPDAPDIINAWVSDKTHAKIEEIIHGPIHPLTVMFLINAIYFLGDWTYQFDPDLTQDDWFNPEEGVKTPCRMMLQPGPQEFAEYTYLETEDFQAVDLPYGNGLYSMTIVLPKDGVDLDALIDGCDADTWADWMGGFHPEDGRIQIPKFEIEYEDTLNTALINLGMGIAFGSGADFSRIAEDRDLFISSVRHKTYVKVDEAGTEAAAVTVVEIRETSQPESFEMRVDRPFVFAIREHHSGTVLFIGKMYDPGL
jgi:serine protease inhibitor